MVELMNAIAQVSAAPVSGPKLDNRRVAAAIVDLLIVSAGAVAILVAGDSLSGERQGALTAVILGWALYYFFALESGEGQTVGKKLMKIRVVRADGRPAGMREVAVRTILRVVDNYLVGLIAMLATGERRQRIGDLAAGTIVVDASGSMVAAAAPAVAEPEAEVAEEAEEADVADEALEAEDAVEAGDEADEQADAAVEDEPVATQTITLPSRPARPSTLADLTEPDAEEAAVPAAEDVAVDEVAEEPVVEVDEPVVEVDEPVADEPVVEVEPDPVVASEPVPVSRAAEEGVADEEAEFPPVASPVIEELADDVAAAHGDLGVEDQPEDDEPVNVKSVQTVSAMDLVMGAAEERAAESTTESVQDPEDPASA
jgi:uncharacterized RDD family membrane protein YckC